MARKMSPSLTEILVFLTRDLVKPALRGAVDQTLLAVAGRWCQRLFAALLWSSFVLPGAASPLPRDGSLGSCKVDLEIDFRVVPETSEVWLLRETGYEFLGRADHKLFVSCDSRDLGRQPSIFRVFYRRPWEASHTGIPARAHSVTLMLDAKNRWPQSGAFELAWFDQILASPRSKYFALAGLMTGGVGFWLIYRARQKRDLQLRHSHLIDNAQALGQTSRPEDLLEFIRKALLTCVDHQAGAVLEHQSEETLALWGENEPLDPERLSTVLEYLQQLKVPLILGGPNSPFLSPFNSHQAMLAVPMLVDEQSVGAILVAGKDVDSFGPQQADTLTSVASQVGRVLLGFRAQQKASTQHKQQAIGILAAGMAHELNTPLGAILLAVDSARDLIEQSPATAGKRLERAASTVDRVHGIVSDLLLFSLTHPQDVVEIDLNGLLEKSLTTVQPLIDQFEIETQFNSTGPQPVRVDPAQLQRAIDHLVRNAIDSLCDKNGPRQLQLRLGQKGPWHHVDVIDNGPGISKHLLESICDPFFTTKGPGKGSGLGLTVAKRVAEIHQGKLTVMSQPFESTKISLIFQSSPQQDTGVL